nr:hypothetical protein [Caulobacter sp. S6]
MLGRYGQDPGQVAADVDRQLIALGGQDDLLDQGAQGLGRLKLLGLGFALQSFVELGDLRAVNPGHLGMQKWRGFFGVGHLLLELGLTAEQFVHLGVDLRRGLARRRALDEHVQQPLDFPLDALDLGLGGVDVCAGFHAQAVALAGELLAEFLEQGRVHQVVAQGVQNARLELVAADIDPVVAGTLVARGRAAELILGDHAVAAAATAAAG